MKASRISSLVVSRYVAVFSALALVAVLFGNPQAAHSADASNATNAPSASKASGKGADQGPRPTAQLTSQSVTLGVGERATLARSGLIVKLIEVKDGRCRANMRCVWAGHATVGIVVSKPGIGAQSLILGTEAPPNMKLPFDASYAGYRLVLTELTPDVSDPTPVELRRFRARIQVTKE